MSTGRRSSPVAFFLEETTTPAACITALTSPDSQPVSSERICSRRLFTESRAFQDPLLCQPLMLQSSVQLPPLSLSSSPKIPPLDGKDTDDYVRSHESTSASLLPNSLNNKCIQKEGFATRPAFAGLPPPSIVPFSISTNLSPSTSSSPSTASSKLPRSPYTSSGRTSSPVSFPGLHSWASKPTTYSRPSSTISSTIEDVLVPGDVVGQGGCLQGETIRLVSIGASPRPWDVADYEQPQEFEVVRRLGTGSYAVVYLVREVLFRTPPSDDGHTSILGPMDLDDKSTRCLSTVYGREYAIKCLSKANLDEEALAAQMSEVRLMCPAPPCFFFHLHCLV